MARIRIGLSGWSYPGWRGDFYPDGMAREDELGHVGERFDTVEVNTTFYRLAKPADFRRWYRSVPPGFVFAVKGSRFITHHERLRDTDQALANFFAQGVLDLDAELGPVLWQLPRNLPFDTDRLEKFLAGLPHDTAAAAALAHRHDHHVATPAYGSGASHRIRHAIEVRHPSHLCGEMVAITRRHGVALVISHAAPWPYAEELTAGFVYLRLHGPAALYASSYDESELQHWAKRIARWHDGGEPADAVRITDRRPPERQGRDVYVYFDNDGGGHAPRNAAALTRMLR